MEGPESQPTSGRGCIRAYLGRAAAGLRPVSSGTYLEPMRGKRACGLS